MYDYLIVGAGISGSVFAERATSCGEKVLVLERRCEVGGNVAQEDYSGISVHKYGPHIFHTNSDYVWEYMNRFSDFNGFINQPMAFFEGALYNLPFNMNTFRQLWNVKTPEEALKKLEEQRKHCKGEPKNLEEYALSTLGEDIYIRFVKMYTEKQWGKKCSELPASFLKRIPMRFTYDNNYFGSKHQGIPTEGYNRIIKRMLKKSDVVCGVDMDDIKKEMRRAGKVIYTGALDELYDYEYGELEWRGLRFETITLDNVRNYQGSAVINYTGQTPYTRVVEHKHFVYGDTPFTVITKEYPENWERGKERYYPIPTDKNIITQGKYLHKAKEDGILPIGRLATYRYIDMDTAVIEAMKAYDATVGCYGN